MPSLKEPQKQIPGGNQFYIADTKWSPAPFSSLDSITQQLIAHRSGRPDLVAKHGWSLDPVVVRQEVEAYQVAVCVRNGWNEYLHGGSESTSFFPTTTPRPLQKVRNLVAGVETLVRWISDGAEAVPSELSTKRASVCAPCPLNKPGGLESWFTVPASKAIRATIERKNEMKLSTPFDDQLFVCSACLCPTALKVHLKLDDILANMPQPAQDALDPNCWIRKRDLP